jgi:hypothetical protein
MTLALVWSAVLAVAAVLAVVGAVAGITVAVRRSLVALAVWLLLRITDLGMATAVLVTGAVCRLDSSSSAVSTVLWALIAAVVSGLALNAPYHRGLADRAALLADQLTTTDAVASRRHESTDDH